MLQTVICGILLTITIDGVVSTTYSYSEGIRGWIRPHKVIATYDEAQEQCKREGAVLAAPVTIALLYEMRYAISVNNHSAAYFIDTRARHHPGIYVSGESVSIEDMPVMDLIERLDPRDGDCLSMDHRTIKAVPCDSHLPYICYKEQPKDMADVNECGTFDRGYRLEPTTGSCYKMHKEKMWWSHAYAQCIAEGGYLVVINNEKESELIKGMIFPKGFNIIFAGLIDIHGKADWISIHGDRVEDIYSKWSYKEQKPSDARYRCGMVHQSGKWQDGSCDFDMPFLCEKDPTNVRFPLSQKNKQYNSFLGLV